MRQFGFLLVLGAVTAGCGNLATIDQVQELRLLAVKAEPPDQVIAYDWDAGAFPPVAPITVTALLADPRGNGRTLHTSVQTCAKVDTATMQCLPGAMDLGELAEIDATPDGGPGLEVSFVFTPSQQLLVDALNLDTYHGFGYLPLPVQLTVSASDPDGGLEQIVGVKTLTFTAPIASPPQSPNHNPSIPVMLLDDAGWPGGPPEPLSLATDGGALFTPAEETSLWESFQVPLFAGGLQQFTEVWSYAFYCTAGQFDAPTSGGLLNLGAGGGGGNNGGPPPGIGGSFGGGNGPPANNLPRSTSTTWKPSDGDPAALVTYWIIVLDGRGGTDWISRQLNYSPP